MILRVICLFYMLQAIYRFHSKEIKLSILILIDAKPFNLFATNEKKAKIIVKNSENLLISGGDCARPVGDISSRVSVTQGCQNLWDNALTYQGKRFYLTNIFNLG